MAIFVLNLGTLLRFSEDMGKNFSFFDKTIYIST
jgi:hypothetical protein